MNSPSKNLSLLHVIPVAKGIGKETLTYFTSEDIVLGSLIEVPIRSRKIKAIVVGREDAGSMKSIIRSANFSIKKIEKASTKSFIDPAFMRAAQRSAEYFATSTGAVLSSLLPKQVLENSELFFTDEKIQKKKDLQEQKFHSHALQIDFNERIKTYIRITETERAKEQSVFILVPTKQDTRLIEKVLHANSDVEIISFHASLSKKVLIEKWEKALICKKPLVIIGTGSFLCLPRTDVSTIIIEHESSRVYKGVSRPFIDFRVFAAFLAKEKNLSLLYADSLLRVETYGTEKGRLEFPSILNMELVDMRKVAQQQDEQKRQTSDKGAFNILSRKALERMHQVVTNNKKVLLYASRKGYATQVICKDCGQSVVCNNCSAPVTLYKSKQAESNFFLCHHCGEKRTALERCKNCQSWNLNSYGVSTEKIEEEAQKFFPQEKITNIDKMSATTEKQIIEKITEFYNDTDSHILIGTEMLVAYIDKPISDVIIISMDSLFALSDFRVNEHILQNFVRLSAVSLNPLLVQTRNPDHPTLKTLLKNNIKDFYDEELIERKRFGYPPSKIVVKIKIEGKNKIEVREQAEKLKEYVAAFNPFIFPAFISTVKNNYIMHLLFKVDPIDWPDHDLAHKLKNLNPAYVVQIDPNTIL